MAGVIPFSAVIFWVFFIIWGSRPKYKIVARTEGVVEEVRSETDRSIHTSGAAKWGANRRSYRLYVRYGYEGRTYVGRSEQAFGRVRHCPGDRVLIGINNVDRESVRILR